MGSLSTVINVIFIPGTGTNLSLKQNVLFLTQNDSYSILNKESDWVLSTPQAPLPFLLLHGIGSFVFCTREQGNEVVLVCAFNACGG
jgi:hypothetical protein